MSRVVLTFKNNEKEKKIEEFLDGKLSPAGYVKELVWAVMNGNNPEIVSTPKTSNEKEENTNDPADGFNFDLDD
ncbi:Uncharacterised protein [uncultured Clostridium sp.]|nr:Uncharacterised protein [uncultured Clostridium sp.]SCJ49652.1 Uncharacterised protein [uncultured Clostridium sp.]